ncbi:hypothetical protein WA538_004892 [Blastocystis sp. DL]
MRGNRSVPVGLTLLYDDFSPVHVSNRSEGSILKVISDQSKVINDAGFCDLNIRIESVSKNHNSKSFVIFVHPDLSLCPQNADIAGDYSTSITVKSKRTSKKRQSNEREIMESSNAELFKRINSGVPCDISPQVVDSSIRFLFEYTTSVYTLINDLQFQLVGHEDIGGVSIELHRCPGCFTYRDNRNESGQETPHDPKCPLNALLMKWTKVLESISIISNAFKQYTERPGPSAPPPFYPMAPQASIAAYPMFSGPALMPANSLHRTDSLSIVDSMDILPSMDGEVEIVYFNSAFLTVNQFPAVDKNDRIIGFVVRDPQNKYFAWSYLPLEKTHPLITDAMHSTQ